MPRMYCMGTSLEIPSSGKICPRLPTNMVPSGTKCEITCSSGSPNVEYIKCEEDGWSIREVYCTGSPTGLIVGLLVGGIIGVCLIAYGYAKWKAHKEAKEAPAKSGVKAQPMTRAAKIAARNDMMVTGVVSQAAISSGVARQAPSQSTGKLVTGQPEEYEYRHPSATSQYSNPPSYHSTEQNDERSRNSTTSSKSRSKRSRNSSTDHTQFQRKHRAYYDEYTEDVDIGYHDEDLKSPTMEGHLYSVQNNGPMQADYYGPGAQRQDHRYGALDQNYYARDIGSYPDHYLNGMDNGAYGHSQHEKPYRVPT